MAAKTKAPVGTASSAPQEGEKELTIEDVWPKGTTVNIDVPAKAGGGTDLRTRYLAQALGEVCPGVNFVVTNYDTAEVGAEHAKNAKPDGLTLTTNHGGAIIQYLTGTSNVNVKDDMKTVGILTLGGPMAIIAMGPPLIRTSTNWLSLPRPIPVRWSSAVPWAAPPRWSSSP